MMRQTMWDLVRLHGRGDNWYWRRTLNMPGVVMVIPVVDGIPIVHKFEIVDKGAIINEQEQVNGRG